MPSTSKSKKPTPKKVASKKVASKKKPAKSKSSRKPKLIYLDNNGTTKICPKAKQVMVKWLSCMSNPSSDSQISIDAKKMIETSKKGILKHCSAKNYTVVYTSGSSE